jgi:uncharacterized membrane protein YfcA
MTCISPAWLCWLLIVEPYLVLVGVIVVGSIVGGWLGVRMYEWKHRV